MVLRAVKASAAANILRRQSIPEIALAIQSEMVGGILSARRLGRVAGADRLVSELRPFGLASVFDDGPVDFSGDELYADRSALSAASAFQTRAARGIRQGLTERDAVRQALQRTEAHIASSGRYAVSTAWQTERERRAIAAQAGGKVRLAKQWDATLDHRTCRVCGAVHGETTFLEEPFSGGTPGAVHPGCRCIEVIRPAWWLGLRDDSDRISGIGDVSTDGPQRLGSSPRTPPTTRRMVTPPRQLPATPPALPAGPVASPKPPAPPRPRRRAERGPAQEPLRAPGAAARRRARVAQQNAVRAAATARATASREAPPLADPTPAIRRADDAAKRAARKAEADMRKAAVAADKQFQAALKRALRR